ncbi:hypothetical protein SMACR_02840 [Sordaria macrospora]|uniref:WGS project CABT00000000 data, contig 2.12 n=2 Tax=Sordaria macrospora TaxID=5147 RepID=F7VXL8_SORMK|nr:uncharacterized protein SMAC_02840 [Sordaria macrospora k-hell]KAA8632810.1 hypothetical protein SMACR_02840 [Sordaria macrospora]KAH7635045.1 hypothetical protein B0T09DRAFT_16918 [Sordaria sp. MPI-SDFR-AT-0083]WPJ58193.1 hypothetical protein SMAC4_02840 [Sordaria macrospora]CCC10262.1 unnamed protein product [Sordaria macrospora k-hell]
MGTASEHTPLVTTVKVEAVPRRRYSHPVARRFFTLSFSSILVWFSLFFIASFTLLPRPSSWPGCGHDRSKVDYEQLRQLLLDTPSSEQAEEWQKYYTAGPHLAGKNYSQALWTKEKWEEFGVKSHIVDYEVYINYPVDHRLALLKKEDKKDDSSSDNWKVSFEATLEEDILAEDPSTSLPERVPVFHGYSASGNVTAPVVYVNYGTYQDFDDLLKANVSLAGKIAIARYGLIFRGLKIKRAQELGMIGVILYSDPGDDGEMTEENGYAPYPEGPARQPSSVQRGSTQFLSVAPGDPTTPGYPSKPGVPRGPVDGAIPSIPSIPISYAEVLPILKALNGHGPKAADFNKWWTHQTGLGYKGVDYNIGPTPDDVVVNLYNEQEYVTTPLWNVIGIINGTIPDEVIVIGNHRDAWIAGGAGDPNSGSAVLNEVIRSFGEALKLGWKPLRTVVFASWDGEEYGLLGSTEWVEEYLPWLSAANVAYLNIDVGVRGKVFSASAAPLLNSIIYAATGAVESPDHPGHSILEKNWDKKITTMGSGSDFTAFQDFAGIPSLDVGFNAGEDDPVYHYHSNYDSFYWMKKYGDPGFVYHRTMAQIFGLLIAELADLPVLAFSAESYATALDGYVSQVEDKLDAALHPPKEEEIAISTLTEQSISELRGRHYNTSNTAITPASSNAALAFRDSLKRLHDAVGKLTEKAARLDAEAEDLRSQAREHIPWYHWHQKIKLGYQIRKLNTKYKYIERSFLFSQGLDGRPWFKHVVFAPGLWTGYSGAVFPGLVESIDARDWTNAEKWVDIIDACIKNAARKL